MIEYALKSLINGLCGGRVEYVNAPQDTEIPYIVLQKISAPRVHSHDGASGLARARFQFTVFAETYKEAKEIAQAMQAILQGYSGTSEDVEIQAILYDNETDGFAINSRSASGNLYYIATDYIVRHKD